MTRREFARLLRRSHHRRYGSVTPLPRDPDAQLARAEAALGFALPPIVRTIFEHAGADFVDLDWPVARYRAWAAEPGWPPGLLPYLEEGCGDYLCLDCSREHAPVLRWRGGDSDEAEPDRLIFERVASSFVAYLRGRLPKDRGGPA